jgi:hypothetical protein
LIPRRTSRAESLLAAKGSTFGLAALTGCSRSQMQFFDIAGVPYWTVFSRKRAERFLKLEITVQVAQCHQKNQCSRLKVKSIELGISDQLN